MDAVCRICMDNSVALVDIFEERTTRGSGEPSLADMLNECAGCKVKEDDKLPKQICDTCVLDCLNAFRFKRTSEQSQERLLELLSEQEESKRKKEEQKNREEQQIIKKEKEEREEEWQLTESSVDLGCVKIENSVFVSCGPEIIPNKKLTPKECAVKTIPTSIVTLKRPLTLNASPGRIIPIDNASPLSGKIYRCTICGREYLQSEKLTRHQLLHNSEFRPFKCNYCPKTFAKRSFLNVHMQCHRERNTRPHKCPYCPKTFTRQLHVQEHLFSHTGGTPYQCNKCDKKFRSLPGYRQHVCLPAHNELQMAHLSLFGDKS